MNRPSYLLFKQCSKCREILHVSKFNKSKNGKYGVRRDCKECQNKYSKKWREEHKEEISEYSKKYYEENREEISEYRKKWREENRDYYNEYNKNYREEHREEISEYNKKYIEEHRDYYNEYCKKWRKENPEKCLNLSNKRRSKKENQGRGIDEIQWYEMMNFFDWKCAYSGEKMESNKTTNGRTIDHIVALDNGGEHEIWNCVPMKKGYNTSKHTKNMLEWYLQQEYFDIYRLTKIYEWRVYAYWKWKDEI